MLKNLDKKNELHADLQNALKSGDEEKINDAFKAFANGIQDSVMAEAKEAIENMNDHKALAERHQGFQLTAEEKTFFNAVIDKGGFEGVSATFPTTLFNDVFERLQSDHPILSRVDAHNVTGLARYVFANPTTATAFWGPLCEDVKQVVLKGFEEVKIDASRLAGFIPVCKSMFALGAEWLATYVIEVLTEAMSATLESAIVDGDGKNKPIGMARKLSGAVDGVYPAKDKVTLKDLTPTSLAGIRGAMAEAKTDNGEVNILVNPSTYWAKVFPALAFRSDNGQWVNDVLPTGEKIILSHAVPKDVLIFGVLKNYFLGVSGDVEINRYKETLAIEHADLFIATFYGHGVAKDRNAFFVADISAIKGGTIAKLETKADPVGV